MRFAPLLPLAAFASAACAESWCDAAPVRGLVAMKAPGAADDWFKVYAVAPGVFAISEPRQAEGVTSFLVIGSRPAVLFDTGLGVAKITSVVGRLTPSDTFPF